MRIVPKWLDFVKHSNSDCVFELGRLPPYLPMWVISSGKWIIVGVTWVNGCTVALRRCASQSPPRERFLTVQCQERPIAMEGRRPGFLTQLSHWLTAWPDPNLRASVFFSRKWQGRMSSSLGSLPVLPTILWLKDPASPCWITASENHTIAARKDSRAPNMSPWHATHQFYKWRNWVPERLRSKQPA